ncbi:Protocatechuate 3,4-dioxygenase subunit beta OS=Streptomyces alboniger OX=132473 GN=pcaH PE=3 SV=1 [Streptomyces alboniger]
MTRSSPYNPVLRSVTDEAARQRLVCAYNHDLSVPEWSLGHRWDIVLDGPSATLFEEGDPR